MSSMSKLIPKLYLIVVKDDSSFNPFLGNFHACFFVDGYLFICNEGDRVSEVDER
jgi:hypothetical protein